MIRYRDTFKYKPTETFHDAVEGERDLHQMITGYGYVHDVLHLFGYTTFDFSVEDEDLWDTCQRVNDITDELRCQGIHYSPDKTKCRIIRRKAAA
jgi:hypothetical protein